MEEVRDVEMENPFVPLPEAASAEELRDVEMEEELTEELHNADAYSDYDIQITKEGETINEYLALLASAPQTSTT